MNIGIVRLAALLLIGSVLSVCGENSRYFRVSGPVQADITAVTHDGHITWTNAATNAIFEVQTAAAIQGVDNWIDYILVPASNALTAHWLFDPAAPSGMTLIPAGLFQMGDALNDGWTPDGPIHTNYVSAIYIDKYEVSKVLWDDVFQWATNHGYSFDNLGSWEGGVDRSKGPDHPVSYVNWYDVVKWCNARSEKELRIPAYYTNPAKTTNDVYRSGQADLQNDWVNWNAGYRLPTEAEWEKAARGGPMGRRFSWAGADTIAHSLANYYSNTNVYPYDVSLTLGLDPDYYYGTVPFTAPGGSFAANGYGVFDTTGNVTEWCWDKYDSTWYTNSLATAGDSRGPAGMVGDNGSRVYRGGAYGNDAFNCRVSYRRATARTGATLDRGFRTVLPAEPSLPPPPPVVTWMPASPIAYGTVLGTNQLNATATVGGTFDYTPTLGTALPVGSNTLSVLFTPTDTNYVSVSAEATVVVLPATLTVTAEDKEREYATPNPELTYVITGFVLGETNDVVSGAPVLSTAATTNSPVGTYPITVDLGTLNAANYTFTAAAGTLTVTPVAGLAFADLGDNNTTSGDTTYGTSSSYQPATNSLLLAFCWHSHDVAVTTPTNMTGNGLAWTRLQTVTFPDNLAQLSCYYASGSAPAAGIGSFDAGQTATGGGLRVVEFQHADLAGGIANAIVQVSTNSGTTANPSLAMAPISSSSNAVIYVVLDNVNSSSDNADAEDRTEFFEVSNPKPTTGASGYYKISTLDSTISHTTTARTWSMIALEIKGKEQ